MVDVWPALPIVIRVVKFEDANLDNVIAALEHNDRVSEIFIEAVPNSAMERIAAAMQRPFPSLTDLYLGPFYGPIDHCPCLSATNEPPAVFPKKFLGGSSPHLRSLWLDGISFPTLPKLLLSTKHLVRLRIEDITRSGYISSKAMTNCLPSLTKLEELTIEFRSARNLPGRETLHPRSRRHPTLPVLTSLAFAGGSEYLENIYACIDAAHLRYANLLLFTPTVFRISPFSLFLGCTEPFQGLNQAHIRFRNIFIDITLSSREETADRSTLVFSIKYSDSVWQLWTLRKCNQRFFPSIESPDRFDSDLLEDRLSPRWVDDVTNDKWVELLRYFSAVEDLYLSKGVSVCLAPTLKEFAEKFAADGVTEALPALKNLFIEELEPSGPLWDPLLMFCAMKHFSGHPVDVRPWFKE